MYSEINDKIKTMSPQELFEWRNSLDVDTLGGDRELEIQDSCLYESEPYAVAMTSDFNIINNLTTVNYRNSYISRIKFIVVHYTANNGDTAWGNTNYFKSVYRGASAHYFVDEKIVYRCVLDEDVSFHCGGGLQGFNGHAYHGICTNSNSIGIEMCSRKDSSGKYYFKDETIENCIRLVKYLMNKYDISLSNVIRHYDVTGKICPDPYILESKWAEFKNKLVKPEEPKHWAKVALDYFSNNKYITNINEWKDLDSPVVNANVLALIDKVSGGTWKSEEANSNIHWCQPILISLCGKGIVSSYDSWINVLDSRISKALILALIDKFTNGMINTYKDRFDVDHWGRNHLDSLCDKGIVQTPSAWLDFEGETTIGEFLMLLYKAITR